ncbi:Eco57I restriction-modification methylase domain-containing protein [Paracidovorax avenae]|uniref:Eco57I restriction-modification methylase domain-containing protein n=1 Tax=Paracidovorax avenae TaxID=80867 RepID=UPI000D206C37|nr:N-6 DNA methylase [Paracidovorax avenae]AVT01640.1 SAM-dependent methyltransferase [Paracidovorax avenae]
MIPTSLIHPTDTPELRKHRGAFFTPAGITEFVAEWAIRAGSDRVLEPSAGDAAFLVAAVDRLSKLRWLKDGEPEVDGVEIHAHSAKVARQRVREAGGRAHVRQGDFFDFAPEPVYDAVIGNPPYIRYQNFSGEARAKSRQAALRGGVALTGLASSWAAFTVHSALFLKPGGRLGLVLPAELLSVNYAAPVRQFLFDRFRQVELVLFAEQVFPEAEADVVLLLADGYGEGPAAHATIRQAKNATSLVKLGAGQAWKPPTPAGKWTGSLVDQAALDALSALTNAGRFAPLETWGDTTLGIVTGNNKYFAVSPARAKELGLKSGELLPLSPPGSAHLRGLALSPELLADLGKNGHSTLLFYPKAKPSKEAEAYIEDGHRTGVDTAYKCRVRKVWHRVPLVRPADLLLTCMNADTPRLVANEAAAYHLNSVHGVYLLGADREIGRELLSLASLNSATLMHAEMVGRAYGGGILKLEPKEADLWAVPSASLVRSRAAALRSVKKKVADVLAKGDLLGAVRIVDRALLIDSRAVGSEQVESMRAARGLLANRREARSTSGR